MTDQARKFEETKKHVSALLISSPAPLTVTELKNDYHGFIGCPLDFRGLGYTTIEDFIREIEDLVHISWKNGSMTVSGKADATTQHIAKLVSKQKVNKKKYAVYRRPSSNRPMQWQGSARVPPRMENQHLTQHIPSNTRNLIKQFFQYFPSGIELSDFQQAFSQTFGFFLGVKKYGFNNLEDVLVHLNDSVLIECKAGVKKVVPVRHSQESTSTNRKSHSSGEDTIAQNVSNNVGSINSQQSGRVNSSASANNQTRPSKGRGRRKSGTESGSQGHVGHSTSRRGKIQVLATEIFQVLENKADGVWCSRLSYEYCDMHGKAMDFREHGYVSVIDFIASEMADLVKYVRPVLQGDWKLYDTKLAPTTESEVSHTKRHASGELMVDYTKESIQKILEHHQQGIPLYTFPDLFKSYTGSILPIEQMGFKSSEELCLSLADSVLQIAYSTQEGLMMYPIDAEIPEDVLEDDRVPETQNTSPLSDVVGPGCHYIPEMCPEKNQFVELYVSNIVNPGTFWVILRHKSKSLKLEALMDKLDEVYCRVDDRDYLIPDSLLVPGQVCATLFPEDNNWHRGVIMDKNDAGFIKVYFVDYGNTSFVPKTTLRYLKNEFLSLPVQAIQCRLANIHPPTGKWKVRSRNRMLELCREKPLVAFVTDVKAQVMSICLTDTSDPNVDLHLNDLLVREGYAVFSPDTDHEPGTKTVQVQGVPDYSHVFGWGAEMVPRLPHCATNTSTAGSAAESNVGPAGDASQVEEAFVCYVKWIQVTKDQKLHLINLEHVAYLISAEISSLLWEEDILTSMLKQRRIRVDKRVVSRDEFPYLFLELQKYKVKVLRSESGDSQQFLSLYHLNDVPDILRVFEHESEELITALTEVRDKFDPDSPFWKPVEDEDVMGDFTAEEQQKALLTLQIRRKRILQMLINNPMSAAEHVQELNNCEIEILVIKHELEKSPKKKGTPASLTSPKPAIHQSMPTPRTDQSAENHRVIQNIMASTTKPIATANIMTKSVTSTSATKTNVSFCNNQSDIVQYIVPQFTIGSVYPTHTSFPGMMGVANLQGQQFASSAMIPQIGGLDPAVAALLSQPGELQAGVMPTTDFGILPGLLPLLQSLSVGRGSPWPGNGSGS